MEESLQSALLRSRMAVQHSLSLPVTSSLPLQVDSRLTTLNDRLRNEAYLRTTYQRISAQLEKQVEELQPYYEEVQSLRAELAQSRLRKEQALALERDLCSQVAQQAVRLAELEEQLHSHRRLSPLERENRQLKSALTELQTRYDQAVQARSHLRRCLI